MMRCLGLLVSLAILMMVGKAAAQPTVAIEIDIDPNSAMGIRIEGLVADQQGRLYTSDLDSRRFFRTVPGSGQLEELTTLPQPATGMAFDRAGNIYMASGDQILRIAADRLGATPFDPAVDVQTFATGVAGANGLAFDKAGNLYVSGGRTGNIYLVATDGVTRTWVSGLMSERPEQPIGTNGLAFGPDGLLYSSNTGSGGIDRIALNPDGSAIGVQRWVTDPLLRGADGIAFAENGDLYVAANERNAVVRITPGGQVGDVISSSNTGPLEFPASPAFVGTSLFISNFDVAREVNRPNEAGIGASIARIDVGLRGAPLPQADPTLAGTPDPNQPTLTATSVLTGTASAVAVTSSPTVTVVTGLPTETVTATVVTGLPTDTPTAAVGDLPTGTVTATVVDGVPTETPTDTAVLPTDGASLPPDAYPAPSPIPIPAELPNTGAPSSNVWLLGLGLLAIGIGISLHGSQRSRQR